MSSQDSLPRPDTPVINDPEVKKAVELFISYLTDKGKDEFRKNIKQVSQEYISLVEKYKELKEKEKERSDFINDIKKKLQGTDLFTDELKAKIQSDTQDGGRFDLTRDDPNIMEQVVLTAIAGGAVAILAGGLFIVGAVLNSLSADQLVGVNYALAGGDPIDLVGILGGSKHKKRKGRKSKKTKKSMKHKKGRKSKKKRKSMKKRKSNKKRR